MDEIVEDARRIAALPGVQGLDLLAYRYTGQGDPAELTRRVCVAVSIPVIAAGSIDSRARVQAMVAAQTWGFTVGSALFQQRFLKATVAAQIEAILQIDGVAAGGASGQRLVVRGQGPGVSGQRSAVSGSLNPAETLHRANPSRHQS